MKAAIFRKSARRFGSILAAVQIRMMEKKIPTRIQAGILALIFTASCATAVKKHVIGQTAIIEVVETGLAFKARIDTGARRTSLHAVDIKVEDPSATMADNVGKKITFTTINEKNEHRAVRAVIREISSVRSSQGEEFRYVVEMALAWHGVSKKVMVNLRDRGRMTYKLLIGRNWLENDFVVDVGRDVPHEADEMDH